MCQTCIRQKEISLRSKIPLFLATYVARKAYFVLSKNLIKPFPSSCFLLLLLINKQIKEPPNFTRCGWKKNLFMMSFGWQGTISLYELVYFTQTVVRPTENVVEEGRTSSPLSPRAHIRLTSLNTILNEVTYCVKGHHRYLPENNTNSKIHFSPF